MTIKQQEAGESREAVSAEGGAVSQGQQATQFWKLEMARKQSPPECLALTTWCSQRSEDVSRLMTSGTVRAHTHTAHAAEFGEVRHSSQWKRTRCTPLRLGTQQAHYAD